VKNSDLLVINQKSPFRKVLEEEEGPLATGPFAVVFVCDPMLESIHE
jgi:hypothetical protein